MNQPLFIDIIQSLVQQFMLILLWYPQEAQQI
jgi:hypothetical protein